MYYYSITTALDSVNSTVSGPDAQYSLSVSGTWVRLRMRGVLGGAVHRPTLLPGSFTSV